MNPFFRLVLKIGSSKKIDMKKSYRTVRKLQQAMTPDVTGRYTILDHKIYSPDQGHNIPVRVFLPSGERKRGVLLFFHGGGWVIGDIETYTPTCAHMAEQTGQIVFSIDYRLAPEHPFPLGLEDCYCATEYLMRHYEQVGYGEAGDFTLIGDSAGANLAAVVSQQLRDRGQKLPDKQILIYPATYWDHNEQTTPFHSVREYGEDYGLTAKKIQEYMELYVPDQALRKSPLVAPLLAENLAEQPETLLISAEYDPLRDEGEAYGQALAKAGNQVSLWRILDIPHGFITYPSFVGAVEESYRIINEFLHTSAGQETALTATEDLSQEKEGKARSLRLDLLERADEDFGLAAASYL